MDRQLRVLIAGGGIGGLAAGIADPHTWALKLREPLERWSEPRIHDRYDWLFRYRVDEVPV